MIVTIRFTVKLMDGKAAEKEEVADALMEAFDGYEFEAGEEGLYEVTETSSVTK